MDGKFAVGYGRADVTPQPGISMSGFAAQGENTRTAESPFEIKFVLSQTNGALGYMPTDMCFDYNNYYECRNCNFARDSAEKIVGVYGRMLQTVKTN